MITYSKFERNELISRLGLIMEKNGGGLKTNLKKFNRFLIETEKNVKCMDPLNFNVQKMRILECVLKEVLVLKGKDINTLENFDIGYLIKTHFNQDALLLEIQKFIVETNNFDVTLDTDESFEYMGLFANLIDNVINSYLLIALMEVGDEGKLLL